MISDDKAVERLLRWLESAVAPADQGRLAAIERSLLATTQPRRAPARRRWPHWWLVALLAAGAAAAGWGIVTLSEHPLQNEETVVPPPPAATPSREGERRAPAVSPERAAQDRDRPIIYRQEVQ